MASENENNDATQPTSVSVPPSTVPPTARSCCMSMEDILIASRVDLSTDELGDYLRRRRAREDELFGEGGQSRKPWEAVGREGVSGWNDGAGVTRESNEE
ncbi:hypothetical protein L202_00903 [Cryptococcus amylolentus CBS 6039]|uniref:Uncharacterized protein n=1 Tax=Cryptococcus amylolentus CBS 6039 TaxID=1295533 RepID=A0A1E3IAZ2_9TREE|nr:hypothetical protein L202_00903 [Cryptococcus amylolentus CBS 6039]ODN85076.1 hypothetical protein L202_00903 [Cryptococcus amylolentus CBS 6039]